MIAIACVAVFGCGDTPGDGPDGTSTCRNGVLDEGETDVDCGGDTCRKCAGGRACLQSSDCFSGNCVESSGLCYAMTLSFAEPVLYPSGFKPYSLHAADLDADGDIDLAVANEAESTIAVFLNTGDGTFERMATSFPTGDYPTHVVVADFNRDGIADVVTADYRGNSVSVLLGAGAGDTYTLAAPATYPTAPGAETSTLAVGDLDGDAVLDVVAANPQAHSISVLLGRPDGTLSTANNIPCGAANSEPYSVAIGDFDSDGLADVAVADNRTGKLVIQRGTGDGGFAPDSVAPDIGGDGSFIMLAHDVDLDGILDLAIANRGSDDVSVLLGVGDGTFRDAITSSTGEMSGPYSIAIDDFNLDGVPDVITANFMSGTGTVLLGAGDGSFEEAMVAATVGEYSYGITSADFNGDGKPDFAVVNAVTNMLAIVMSTAN
jgi:hypothetical protein